MEHQLRWDLVKALLRVPGTESWNGRLTLTSGLDGLEHKLTRDQGNAEIDLELVVKQLAALDPRKLLVVLDNALFRCRDSGERENDLRRLRSKLEAALAAPAPQPAPAAKAPEKVASKLRRARASDSVQPWSFDLGPSVEACMRAIHRRRAGLFGLGVSDSPEGFPLNLCMRLQRELRVSQIEESVHFCQLDSLGSPVRDDRTDVLPRLKDALTTGKRYVIIAVRSPDEQRAARFWQAVRGEFDSDDRLACRLIVMLAMPPGATFPEAFEQIDPPVFTDIHMQQWARSIPGPFKLGAEEGEKLVEFLLQRMHSKCAGEQGAVGGDRLYRFLDKILLLLSRRVTIDEFYRQIDNWG